MPRSWCRGPHAPRRGCRSARGRSVSVDSRRGMWRGPFRPASAALKGPPHHRLCACVVVILGAALAVVTAREISAQQDVAGPISFSRTVYPIFEAAQCRGCHTDDGVASATRLHFPEPNASPDDIQAFGITLAVLVDRADPERSLLLNKPTNRVRHTGGLRIEPGSFGETALREWIRQLATVPDEQVAA